MRMYIYVEKGGSRPRQGESSSWNFAKNVQNFVKGRKQLFKKYASSHIHEQLNFVNNATHRE